MRSLLLLLLGFTLWGQATQQPAGAAQLPILEEFKKRIASFPPDDQVYEALAILGHPTTIGRSEAVRQGNDKGHRFRAVPKATPVRGRSGPGDRPEDPNYRQGWGTLGNRALEPG